jgi:hypothetical protein
MTHALKTLPEYFKYLENGSKTFELRKDDRPFSEDDIFLAQEYDGKTKQYTGNELSFVITLVLRDVPKFGLKPGYCILSLQASLKINQE